MDHEFAYTFRTSNHSISIPVSSAEIHVLGAIDLRQSRCAFGLKMFRRHSMSLSKEVRLGTSLRLSFKSMTHHRFFGDSQAYTLEALKVEEILPTARIYRDNLLKYGTRLSTEYGAQTDMLASELTMRTPPPSTPVFEEAQHYCWCSYLTGLRFPEDCHIYTILTHCGTLDLIRHDPATGAMKKKIDARDETQFQPTNCGKILVFNRQQDLAVLTKAMCDLVDILESTKDSCIQRMCIQPTRSGKSRHGPTNMLTAKQFAEWLEVTDTEVENRLANAK